MLTEFSTPELMTIKKKLRENKLAASTGKNQGKCIMPRSLQVHFISQCEASLMSFSIGMLLLIMNEKLQHPHNKYMFTFLQHIA